MKNGAVLLILCLLLCLFPGCDAETPETTTSTTTPTTYQEQPTTDRLTIGGGVLSRFLITTNRQVIAMMEQALATMETAPTDESPEFLHSLSVSLGDRSVTIDQNNRVTFHNTDGCYVITSGDFHYDFVKEVYDFTDNDSALFIPAPPWTLEMRDGDRLFYTNVSQSDVDSWLKTVATEPNTVIVRHNNLAFIQYNRQSLITLSPTVTEGRYLLSIISVNGKWQGADEAQICETIAAQTGNTVHFALPVNIDAGGGTAYTANESGDYAAVKLPGLYEDTGYQCVLACLEQNGSLTVSYYAVRGNTVLPLDSPYYTVINDRKLLINQVFIGSGILRRAITLHEYVEGEFQPLGCWVFPQAVLPVDNSRFYNYQIFDTRFCELAEENTHIYYRHYTLRLEGMELALIDDGGNRSVGEWHQIS